MAPTGPRKKWYTDSVPKITLLNNGSHRKHYRHTVEITVRYVQISVLKIQILTTSFFPRVPIHLL